MREGLWFLAAAAFVGLATPAGATLYVNHFDQLTQSAVLAPVLLPGDGVLSQTSVLSAGPELTPSLQFTAGAGVEGIQGGVRWVVGSNVRLVGVDVQPLDSTNTVVANDDFLGLNSGFGISRFGSDALTPGESYTLRVAETAARIAAYNLFLSAAGDARPPTDVPAPASIVFMVTGLVGPAAARTKSSR